MYRNNVITVCLALALLLVTGAQRAEAQKDLVLLPESRVWIEGSSTVNRFTCEANEIAGHGSVDARSLATRVTLPAVEPEADGSVTIPLSSFDCGNRRMNEDFLEAMKAQTNPVIRYELDSVRVLNHSDSTGSVYRIRAEGSLTLAGTTRPIEVTVLGRHLSDGRLAAEGRLPLRMTDFGIRPPTALLGLIKAHDHIVVRFDLVAAPLTR